jgi:hypothetical protein
MYPILEVPLSAQFATTTVAHDITVATAVYAQGHIVELTQYLPFELVTDTKLFSITLADFPTWHATGESQSVMVRSCGGFYDVDQVG